MVSRQYPPTRSTADVSDYIDEVQPETYQRVDNTRRAEPATITISARHITTGALSGCKTSLTNARSQLQDRFREGTWFGFNSNFKCSYQRKNVGLHNWEGKLNQTKTTRAAITGNLVHPKSNRKNEVHL
jgi:hypothetical protein